MLLAWPSSCWPFSCSIYNTSTTWPPSSLTMATTWRSTSASGSWTCWAGCYGAGDTGRPSPTPGSVWPSWLGWTSSFSSRSSTSPRYGGRLTPTACGMLGPFHSEFCGTVLSLMMEYTWLNRKIQRNFPEDISYCIIIQSYQLRKVVRECWTAIPLSKGSFLMKL